MRMEIKGDRNPIGWDIAKFSFRVWFAPEIGRYVKVEHETWLRGGRITTNEAVELVRFNPAS